MINSEEIITKLEPNQIFVFGSNLSGLHGGGAAKLAYQKFAATWGNGIGIQGQTYAIPTKDYGISRTLTLEEIKPYVNTFIDYATKHTQNIFLVTEIGCGLAGLSIEQVAPLFEKAVSIENIHLPIRFTNFLTQ